MINKQDELASFKAILIGNPEEILSLSKQLNKNWLNTYTKDENHRINERIREVMSFQTFCSFAPVPSELWSKENKVVIKNDGFK